MIQGEQNGLWSLLLGVGEKVCGGQLIKSSTGKCRLQNHGEVLWEKVTG